MRNGFSTKPSSRDMITQVLSPTETWLLCAECSWEGVASLPNSPWPVFMTHECKLRVRSVSECD